MNTRFFCAQWIIWTIAICLLTAWMAPATGWAECSQSEFTAVFIVGNIYPLEPQLITLDVAEVGPNTNPTEAEMIAELDALFSLNHFAVGEAGPYHLFMAHPYDFGSCGIVDGRDGRIVFAGSMIWDGLGYISLPNRSSHPWSFTPGYVAPYPTEVNLLPVTEYWNESQYDSADVTTEAALDLLRTSDAVWNFAGCGDYRVTSFIYTPQVGFTEPLEAQCVIIVSGHCDAPFNAPVAATEARPSGAWEARVAPNPFNPTTTLRLNVRTTANITVAIHDARGRLVARLAEREFAPGEYPLTWDGLDMGGQGVASGVYFARISSVKEQETIRLTLVR